MAPLVHRSSSGGGGGGGDKDHHRELLFSSDKMVKKGKKSFGIICIESKSPYRVLVCCSPSYAAVNVIMNNKRRDCGNDSVTLSLNSYESQNILLSSFPHGCIGEGQYTFPRGQIAKIDKNDKCRTKIREFVEEAKHFYPELGMYNGEGGGGGGGGGNRRHHCSRFNWLTNDDYCVREKWIGLDYKLYTAEYSILIIRDDNYFDDDDDNNNNQMNDNNNNKSKSGSGSGSSKIFLRSDNTIPVDYIFKELACFGNCEPRERKKYINQYIARDRHIDRYKTHKYIPLKEALNLIKMNRILTIEALDEKKILDVVVKKY